MGRGQNRQGAGDRRDRLGQALKANLQRRKARARAPDSETTGKDGQTDPPPEGSEEHGQDG